MSRIHRQSYSHLARTVKQFIFTHVYVRSDQEWQIRRGTITITQSTHRLIWLVSQCILQHYIFTAVLYTWKYKIQYNKFSLKYFLFHQATSVCTFVLFCNDALSFLCDTCTKVYSSKCANNIDPIQSRVWRSLQVYYSVLHNHWCVLLRLCSWLYHFFLSIYNAEKEILKPTFIMFATDAGQYINALIAWKNMATSTAKRVYWYIIGFYLCCTFISPNVVFVFGFASP